MVPDASKNRPSIEAMQPSVQCGSSISAIVVPYWPLSPLFSHSARPQPLGLADLGHRLHDVVVLGVRRPALVAEEVVARPTRRPERRRRWPSCAAGPTRTPACCASWNTRRPSNGRTSNINPSTSERTTAPTPPTVIEPASHAGRLTRAGRLRHAVDDQADHLDDADHHQQVAQEVDERQQARVPQQADDRQAVAGQVDEGDEGEADRRRAATPLRWRRAMHATKPIDRQRRDEDVERRGEREEHVPERVAGALRPGAVLHVGHVLVVERGTGRPTTPTAARR